LNDFNAEKKEELDIHVTDVNKPKLDEYVENNSKPSLNDFNAVKKEELDSHKNEKIEEINDHVNNIYSDTYKVSRRVKMSKFGLSL